VHASSPPLRFRLSHPELADDLVEALSQGDCLCMRVDDGTFLVVHREARDEAEARVEVDFFLKAWVARFADVQAELC
jgi:hypothetical protein